MFSNGLLHIDILVIADLKTCQEQWLIVVDGES